VSLSPLAKGAGLITGSYDIPVATLRARGNHRDSCSSPLSLGRKKYNLVLALRFFRARDLFKLLTNGHPEKSGGGAPKGAG
jgi:hypothetical protein